MAKGEIVGGGGCVVAGSAVSSGPAIGSSSFFFFLAFRLSCKCLERILETVDLRGNLKSNTENQAVLYVNTASLRDWGYRGAGRGLAVFFLRSTTKDDP